MHYHLDTIGGIAGDMFAAALLDYHPEWKAVLAQSIRHSGLAFDLRLRALEHNDGILFGTASTWQKHRIRICISTAGGAISGTC